ncbi:mismatch-specific DNA-glycosylase [Gordonia jinhuaensis]|uniref:Mismatch-specific DNA-glycosylase n=1 Tax=Gordonia jinhuaensis TaxID=1517702 RepID=A0A916THL6_9ACTN|nr:mismatch-specific DNA-glycosylase [Gordonia jinhuaensis]GGB45611.1 mismatch-specific DNA-glycosylase [Gordonia jinhuaensis]
MGLTQAQLRQYAGRRVDDLIGPDCRLLFVGINPSLWTAAVGAHFARPGNRFYPALLRAGIIDRPIDASAGMSRSDEQMLRHAGVGITNLVARATARADELTDDELRSGAAELIHKVERIAPVVVAFAGITAYRQAFAERGARSGRQDRRIGDSVVWVVPNPSGLNAHETVDSLARCYRSAAEDAGISLSDKPVD